MPIVRVRLSTVVASAFFVAALCGPIAAQSPTPTPVDCEAVRCQLQNAINTCANNPKNHGQFVSCVSHAIKQAAVPPQCHGKIMRCAAQSTFGKPAFETCQTQSAGTCDTTTGACTDGTLTAGLTACTQNSDCVVTQCHTMRAFPGNTTPTPGADKCTLAGGTPGTGSCCPACATAPSTP